MSRTRKVRRTLGWLGYFWWEFHRDLAAELLPAFCSRCGKVITKKNARRYCSREENPECFRKRHAEVQRHFRAKTETLDIRKLELMSDLKPAPTRSCFRVTVSFAHRAS